MKNSIILFLFLIPAFLFAQYPTGSNKSRLGWQTTGDGLIWRGVAGDTVNKPNNRNYPYFQLDTVNAVLYRFIQTKQQWQPVSESVNIDSLIYATRFWVNSNFFPLQGGLLTGTGGNGFVGFPVQSSPPATPSTGFSLYAGSTGNNISWMQPDGFFRRLVSPVTGTPRQYQFMSRSYTLGDSADIANNVTSISANYLATSNGTNLVARNLFDNNTYVGILNSKPFALGQWTTAGRPGSVDGYIGRNTTTGFDEGYFTSEWRNYVTSTGATSGQVSVFSSAGQVYGTSNFFWDNTNGGLQLISNATTAGRGLIVRQTNSGIQAAPINFEKIRGASAVQNGDIIGAFALRGYSGTQYVTDNALFGGLVTGTVTSSSVPTSIFFNAGSTTGNYNTQLLVHSGGNVGIGEFGSILSGASIVAPSSPLHVRKTVAGDEVTIISQNLSASGRGSITAINSSGVGFSFSKRGTSSSAYKFIGASSGALYTSTGDMDFLNDNASGKLKFGAGGASTEQLTLASTGNLLLGTTTDVSRRLHVSGEARITDLTTDPPTQIVGADADGDLGAITVSTGLSLSSGVLTATGASTWLKTELEAGRDVDITGGTSTDFRLRSNTRMQVDGKFKIGADSSFVHDPAQDTTFIKGNVKQNGFIYTQAGTNATRDFSNIFYMKSDGAYSVAGTNYANPGIGKFNWFILNDQRNYGEDGFGIKNENLQSAFGPPSYTTLFTIRNNGNLELGYPYHSHYTRVNSDTFMVNNQYLFAPSVTTSTFYAISDPLYAKTVSNYKFYVGADSTLKFDPVNDLLQLSQYGGNTKTATALSKTFSTLAGFATDGTVLNVERKRDTTIYVTDADYNFSAAITSTNILKRYNNIVIYSKLSASSTSDNQIFLHTPSSDFLQCTIIIYSNDASTDSDATSVDFTTNGAVDGAGGTLSSYAMAPGQRVEIRVADDGGYKWFFN